MRSALRVFDVLTAPLDDARRLNYYVQLVGLYDRSNRPDLACRAVQKLTEMYVAAKRPKDAMIAMAATMQRYPDEGRYVPAVAARLEEVSKDVKGGSDLVMQFYVGFLPKIPTHRFDEVSEYCVKMHKRAIAYLKENKQERKADELAVALDKIQSGGKRK